jgi:hypothetical protein
MDVARHRYPVAGPEGRIYPIEASADGRYAMFAGDGRRALYASGGVLLMMLQGPRFPAFQLLPYAVDDRQLFLVLEKPQTSLWEVQVYALP